MYEFHISHTFNTHFTHEIKDFLEDFKVDFLFTACPTGVSTEDGCAACNLVNATEDPGNTCEECIDGYYQLSNGTCVGTYADHATRLR